MARKKRQRGGMLPLSGMLAPLIMLAGKAGLHIRKQMKQGGGFRAGDLIPTLNVDKAYKRITKLPIGQIINVLRASRKKKKLKGGRSNLSAVYNRVTKLPINQIIKTLKKNNRSRQKGGTSIRRLRRETALQKWKRRMRAIT